MRIGKKKAKHKVKWGCRERKGRCVYTLDGVVNEVFLFFVFLLLLLLLTFFIIIIIILSLSFVFPLTFALSQSGQGKVVPVFSDPKEWFRA